MPKINKHIEIVRSPASAFSSMGQKSAAMIRSVLEQHYERVEISLVNDLSDLEAVASKRPDLVFLGIKWAPVRAHATTGAKVWTAAYFDSQGIAYTGSDAAAIALDLSKPAAKSAVAAAGLPTAASFAARPGAYATGSALPLAFPLFVKPPNAGGGKGIGADSVVRDFAGFQRTVERIEGDFHTDALVEAYLPGREFSVALLRAPDSDELIAMPVELITEPNDQGDRILGHGIKKADTERLHIVPDGVMRQAIIDLATKAFRALGARDYGRIDIRLDERGVPYFLEANLVPGLSQHDFMSYFTAACQLNLAMDHPAMILHITQLGLSRSTTALDPLDHLRAAALVLDTRAPLKPALGSV